MTARNPGEDSQREIMLNPDMPKIDVSSKQDQPKNPKKLQQLNSIDTVLNSMGKAPIVVEVKDEKMEDSKQKDQKAKEIYESMSRSKMSIDSVNQQPTPNLEKKKPKLESLNSIDDVFSQMRSNVPSIIEVNSARDSS